MIKTKLTIILAIATSLVLVVTGCGDTATAPEIGNMAPNFTLNSIDGGTVTLNDLQGRPVMVNFWATWCVPCVGEMPHIQAVYDKYSTQEAVIITINTRQSAEAAKAFIASHGFNFPVLVDSQGKVAQDYRIAGIPMTFFIDAKGVIKAIKLGAFQSTDEIESMLDSL